MGQNPILVGKYAHCGVQFVGSIGILSIRGKHQMPGAGACRHLHPGYFLQIQRADIDAVRTQVVDAQVFPVRRQRQAVGMGAILTFGMHTAAIVGENAVRHPCGGAAQVIGRIHLSVHRKNMGTHGAVGGQDLPLLNQRSIGLNRKFRNAALHHEGFPEEGIEFLPLPAQIGRSVQWSLIQQFQLSAVRKTAVENSALVFVGRNIHKLCHNGYLTFFFTIIAFPNSSVNEIFPGKETVDEKGSLCHNI